MRHPDQRETIARTLAVVERRVRDIAAPQADLRMTGLSDVVTDIEDVLKPLLDAIVNVADRLDLPREERSLKGAITRGAPFPAEPARLTGMFVSLLYPSVSALLA
jgi:hypothetical protein